MVAVAAADDETAFAVRELPAARCVSRHPLEPAEARPALRGRSPTRRTPATAGGQSLNNTPGSLVDRPRQPLSIGQFTHCPSRGMCTNLAPGGEAQVGGPAGSVIPSGGDAAQKTRS
ncbi:hypothetical protein ABZX40_30415 [Streptomyces sp. NPDC004610]|uniref:DUF6207 family protein n=1 Tax=unclassified Streptomyces TaxID=2593676 RepID=UPI0033B519B4